MQNTKSNNLTVQQKLDLLTKSLWDYKDISSYFEINKNKSIEIKNEARAQNNNLPKYDPAKATIDSVMKVMGISLDDEIKKLRTITGADELALAPCAPC